MQVLVRPPILEKHSARTSDSYHVMGRGGSDTVIADRRSCQQVPEQLLQKALEP